jgi:hypothetical protein
MRKPQVEGHWHSLIEGFATSSLDFYELVKAGIARREIPDLKISQVEWKESGLGSGKRTYLRVSREGLNFDICAAPFGTGYFFSWWLARIPRILLDFLFLFGCFFVWWLTNLIILTGNQDGHGCGLIFAPFILLALVIALGFLVRYGDTGLEPTVVSMPITGFCYSFVFRPQTYFNEDTALMFRETVHHAVTEAIDQVTSAQGIRGLSEKERQVPGTREEAPGPSPSRAMQ